MKDLYDRLNLSPDVTESMIRQRLRQIEDEELERTAREILLHSGRKEVYDRNHQLLKTIGDLRARLKLNSGANWRKGKASQDFSVASKEVDSQEQIWEARKAPTPTWISQQWLSTVGVTPSRLLSRAGQLFLRIATRRAGLILFLGILGIVIWTSDGDGDGDSSEFSPDESVDVSPKLDVPTKPKPDVQLDVPTKEGTGSGDDVGMQGGSDTYPHDPEPLPENGTWWDYTSDRQIAPLQISVSSDEHYYVKVLDAYTEERIMALFIRSGRTASLEVPTGTYRLRYAVGETWYGQEHQFGPETKYFEAEDTFTFESEGRQVTGHEIELILQTGGNLSTQQIPKGKF